jgi:hypothetical protein
MRRAISLSITLVALCGCSSHKRQAGAGDAHRYQGRGGAENVFRDCAEAIRTGDAALYLGLLGTRMLESWQFDAARRQAFLERALPARPDAEQDLCSVVIFEDTAAAFGTIREGGTTAHLAMRLVLEGRVWKLDGMNEGPHPFNEAAYLPPPGGRFQDAEGPWGEIPVAGWVRSAPGKDGVEARAVRDESYLHVRFRFAQALPPANAELADGDAPAVSGLPIVLQVRTADEVPRDCTLTVKTDHCVKVAGTEDDHMATELLHFLLYELRFSGPTPDFCSYTHDHEPLIRAAGDTICIRLPLACLGGNVESDTDVLIAWDGPAGPVEYQVTRFR